MIYSYFSPFITTLLSHSLVLSTFLSRAQSSASEPIGWIGCNDRLTNREQRNTKGSVSLHQPLHDLITESPGKQPARWRQPPNQVLPLCSSAFFFSLLHLIDCLFKKERERRWEREKESFSSWVYLDSWWVTETSFSLEERKWREWWSEEKGRSGETQSDSGYI